MAVRAFSELRQSLIDAGYDAETLREFQRRHAPADPAPQGPAPDIEWSSNVLTAALSGYFTPARSLESEGSPAIQEPVNALLSASEAVVSGGRRVWQLRPEVRRQALLNAHETGTLTEALRIARADPEDAAGRILRDALAGRHVDLEHCSRDDFEPLTQVIRWVGGTPVAPGLPSIAEVRRVQQRRELIEPFLTLVGRSVDSPEDASRDRFVGRTREVEKLRAYVGIVPPDKLIDLLKRGASSIWATLTPGSAANEPLRVEGAGGAGKSTLLAKFILDHAFIPGVRLPFIYLDFDRATIAPREPLQLLIDISLQLAVWMPEADEPLRRLRHGLRDRIEQQARNVEHKDRERQTRSELRGLCQRLKTIVETVNQGRAPVLVLLDTFEIVQYNREAVEGVLALLDALREPEAGPWANLRIVVAGRGKLSEIITSHTPLKVGPLTVRATQELLARRNKLDELGLSDPIIAALARPLSESPLDVITITRWFEQHRDQAAEFTREFLADPELPNTAEPPEMMEARVSALLVERMIKHIADKRVRALALPGFVVRAISADAIREIMIPAARAARGEEEGDPLSPAQAHELFRRLEGERWLVVRQGPLLRHRPEVRRAMLQLMRKRDPAAFFKTNDKAIHFFLHRLSSDRAARAEAIYHLLLAEVPAIEEADRLWRPEVASLLSRAVEELDGSAADYLRVRLGRGYGLAQLERLPDAVLESVLASAGSSLLKRVTPEECLQLLALRPEAAGPAIASGVQAEALYRAGHWPELAEREAEQFDSLIEQVFDLKDGRPPHRLRQLVLLSTRDPSLDRQWLKWAGELSEALDSMPEPFFWDAAALLTCLGRRVGGFEVGRVFEAVARRCGARSLLGSDIQGSAALRIVALLDRSEHLTILRCVDLSAHLATVNVVELRLFRDMLDVAEATNWNFLPAAEGKAVYEAVQQGRTLLNENAKAGGNRIILDPAFTTGLGALAQTLLDMLGPAVAFPVRQLLSLAHPDWVEPLGVALQRAYDGHIPIRLGWFNSIDLLLGQEQGRGRRGTKAMSGHQILSLADEAGQLYEAVTAYRENVLSRSNDPGSFPYLVDCLEQWTQLFVEDNKV